MPASSYFEYSEGSQRVLRQSGTQRILWHSNGTWRALGFSGTRALRTLRHSGTWALRALWALRHSEHSGTSLGHSIHFI